MSKKLKPFFGKKICMGCKKPAELLRVTATSTQQLCRYCEKKLLNKPFNGISL